MSHIDTQPGSPNFDGAEAFEAFQAAGGYSCETGQIDEALANFLAEHTNLNQDGIDTHAMTMTLAVNYAAINPTPESDIAEWREQGYIDPVQPVVTLDLTDVLSAMLWLYHRLPRAYGRVRLIEEPIAKVAKVVGANVDAEFTQREPK